MNERLFPPLKPPEKEGPFLPGLKTRGILARISEKSSRLVLLVETSSLRQLVPGYL